MPVMLGDAQTRGNFARQMLAEGIYVISFSHPIVAMGRARIRVQLSAAHTREHIDKAVAAFVKVGTSLGAVLGGTAASA